MALRCVGDMEAYWTYALSTDMADFVHCEPRWYLTRVIALRMGGMQQYGISVSIFEQGNLQGNSSGPSDPPGLVVCLFFLFPPGAFRQLALSLYIEFLTHQSYRAFVLTPVLHGRSTTHHTLHITYPLHAALGVASC